MIIDVEISSMVLYNKKVKFIKAAARHRWSSLSARLPAVE